MTDTEQPRPPESSGDPSASPRSDMGDEELQHLHDPVRMEKDEPREGLHPGPVVLLMFMIFGISFWAGIYLIKGSGGFQWDIYDPNYQPGGKAAGEVAAFDPIKRGARVYRSNCSACHQADGSGVAGVYPPLAKSDWVGKSPDILVRIVLHGLAGEIVVNGNTYSGAAMNAFADILSDRDVASVLTYVRQEWGNQYDPVDEATVAAIRTASGGRSSPWSPAELLDSFGD